MVVIVVLRTKSMKTPTNCYLVSLSIADLMVLIAAVPNEIISYYVLGDQWIWGRVGCALFIFLQYLGINASSLSITSFTIERYIAICHPMRAQQVCTVHRAKRIIAGVWIFACIYCSPWIFLTKVEPIYYKGYSNIETCTFALSRKHYLGIFFTDLILFYVFPLLLSCVLYGLIARILFTNTIPKIVGNGYPISAETRRNPSSNDHARIQVVKMLVVVVAVFATLWLPYRAWVVYNSFAEHRYMELWFVMFSKTMIFVNSAINPILYNALSIKFRRAFKRMFSCTLFNRSERRRRSCGAHLSVRMSSSSRNNFSTMTTCTLKTTSYKNREKFQYDL
ncbi:thyrotropin-releasing hormone receptor-like protein, partial [Dinothrombium tinctorium]